MREKVTMKPGRRVVFMRCLSVPCLCVPASVILYLAFILPASHFDLRGTRGDGFSVSDPLLPLVGEPGQDPVEALVGAIRSATVASAGFRNISFSYWDAETWKKSNPCIARQELGLRYARRPHAKQLDPNPQWDKVLEEYSALHRTCMSSVGNITAYFESGATTSTCQFLIMEIQGVGLGNKVALLTSAILYAVLTQRVILLNGMSYIPWTICEPFLGSSWFLEQHFPLPERHGWENTMLGRWTGWESPIWKSSAFFEKGVDATKAGRDTAPASAVKIDFSDPEVKRFYCNTEQALLTKTTWLHFTGCLYFLPKLFAIPSFRPALEGLFPDPTLALTYLLRSLMLPVNDVWEQVKQQDSDLFNNVDRRVGIQVRFLYGRKVYFQKASKRANGHVKQCLAENNILPNVVHEAEVKTLSSSNPRSRQVIRIFLTSLHASLYEELSEMYDKHETVTGETVKITQLTNREKQRFSVDEDRMAMVEILLLSFVDELLVTPLSTFGGLAQSYGAILPWFIEVKRNKGSCVRAQSVDLCYQKSHSYYDCAHESNIDRKEIHTLVPYIRACLPIEENDGVQLVPLSDVH